MFNYELQLSNNNALSEDNSKSSDFYINSYIITDIFSQTLSPIPPKIKFDPMLKPQKKRQSHLNVIA